MRAVKVMALVLGIVGLALGPATAAAAATTVASPPFSDVTASTPYASAIDFLAQEGIVSGTGGGAFDPKAPVTRAQMAKIVVNLDGNQAAADALSTLTPSFTDAATIPTWAWGYINAAQAMGIIKGFPDGSFGPNDPVTEAEALAMFTRLLGDDWTVSGTWPTNYMLAGYNLGIATDLSGLTPDAAAPRGVVAQMAYNTALTTQYTVTSQGATRSLAAGGLYGRNLTQGTYPQALSGTVGTDTSGGNLSLTTGTGSGATTVRLAYDSSVLLVGGAALDASLNGASVTVVRDTNELINWIDIAAAVTAGTPGTLNDGTQTQPPAGFYVPTVGTVLAANTACKNGATTGCNPANPNGYLLVVQDSSGNNYLLFKDGTTVEYDAQTQLNLNTVGVGLLAGAEPEDLYPGATITYTTLAGISNAITEVNWTALNARVTAVNPASGVVTYTLDAGNAPHVTAYVASASNATVTLDGSTDTVTDLQPNDIVNLELTGRAAPTAVGTTTPATAVAVDATDGSVSGTVTAVNTTTGSSGVPTVTVSIDGTSLTTDSNFPNPGTAFPLNGQVTVALDLAGDARYLLGSSALTTPVVMLTGTGTSATSSGSSVTLLGLGSSSPTSYVEGSGFQCVSSDASQCVSGQPVVTKTGFDSFWALTLDSSGDVAAATYLAPVATGGDTLQVLASGPSAVTLEAMKGGSVDTTFSAAGFSGGYAAIVNGGAWSSVSQETFLGFAGVESNDQVTLYAIQLSGQWYYAIVDHYR